VIETLTTDGEDAAGPQFITIEHWRLQQFYPNELARATEPFTNLLLPEIRAAADSGQLRPANPEYDAWLVNQLVLSVYHHYARSRPSSESPEYVAERVWSFCRTAPGGTANTPEVGRVNVPPGRTGPVADM